MGEEEMKVVKEEVKKVILSDTTKSGGAGRRNSTGKANNKTSPSLLSSDEKIPPHCLRASTSSCHDFCKYGRKHVFEAKKRNANFQFSDSSKIQDKEEKPEVLTLQGRRKRPETKVKSTKPEGVKLSDTNAVIEIKSFDQPESLKHENPLPSQGHVESLELSLSIESEVSSETARDESSPPTEKRVVSHEPTIPFSLSEKSLNGSKSIELDSSSPINRPKDQGSSEEPKAPSPTQKSLKAQILPSTRKSAAAAKVQASEKDLSMKPRTKGGNSMNNLKAFGKEREMKTSPPLKTEISVETKVNRERKTDLTEQKVVEQKKVIKPVSPKVTRQQVSSTTKRIDTPVMKSAPILISSKRVSALRNIGNKLMKSIDLSKPRAKPAAMPSRAPLSKKTEEKVKEKTLYVLEPTTSKTGAPKKKELKKIRAQPSSGSPKYKEKRITSKTSPSTVSSKVKSPSPHTLKFQRGKIISPMPENNSPWKLKFRPAKGIILNNEAARRSFRRRRGSFGSASELSTPRLKGPSVVLRHQDVKEKKGTQGLFNHVIEETANKLVEAKKSKVKALVGAFETVISLQEGRVK
ncbi:uncharacterized protein A4U43_C07F30170 [Asparagus officinalis]|uniref:Calmodulin-binding domain-containing protein n=1 Tax=Asparagus officinalis TaxID=4686 RepID=A0A5P1EFY2_ASPOF|nr:uncharacterized protein LOC109849780 [Asparagus officinalis]XP_020275244.1 uncharacterized protein LOC109849780 [Asparagus officinalis]ONK64808.1 uncharacterized protein A4U43_C07F30170 [Asparagus officinalis]